MGLRFDINVANWIAYLLQSGAKVPPLTPSVSEYELLDALLYKLSAGFRSSVRRKEEFGQRISEAKDVLEKYKWNSRGIADRVLAGVKADLNDRAWTALIVPCWTDPELDRILCSDELLTTLVEPSGFGTSEGQSNVFGGLVLQLEEPDQPFFPLIDVFPPFQTALNNNHQWPGLLVWTNRRQSSFFPIPSEQLGDRQKIMWHLKGLIDELNHKIQLGPPGVPILPHREEPESARYSDRIVHLIQISDVHLGTKEAGSRLPQLQRWIRRLTNDLAKTGLVIPIVTGDLMNTNNKACVNQTHLFMDFLTHLGTEKPHVLLGNHDVRVDGIIREDFKAAAHIFAEPPDVYWYDDQKFGLVCFNSVLGGDLARGEITEEQRIYLDGKIAEKDDWQDYLLVAALHHHPLKMELPDWYVRPFYEKIFGSWFGVTDKLIDAEEFVEFVENHRMGLVIHGHKHIPKIDKTPGKEIPVFGCGSSVGKVKRKNRKSYLSLNVLTIDTHERRVTGRLLAQPVGGGFDHVEDSADWSVRRFVRSLWPGGGAELHEQQLIYRRIV